MTWWGVMRKVLTGILWCQEVGLDMMGVKRQVLTHTLGCQEVGLDGMWCHEVGLGVYNVVSGGWS